MKRILYLVYWGALEPLGQSLVVPAVLRLADLGAKLTLVTFEKPAHFADSAEMARLRDCFESRGVRWLPQAYHKRSKTLAKALDFAQAWTRGLGCALRERFDMVHARTYVGGLMGLILARSIGARFIYHNEGFYPDEQVDAGIWRAGSLRHRFAKRLERILYNRADGIVALSHAAREVIEQLPAVRRQRTPVVVVPSCVNLAKFSADNQKKEPRPPLRLVYAGSVGGRYRLDRIGAFAAAAARELGSMHLRVLTNGDPAAVTSILQDTGLRASDWSSDSVPSMRVPQELAGQHAGIHFLPRGISEHGGSPTKIGEYWACGLPVIATPRMGDTEDVIRRERVGVVVSEHSEHEYRRAAAQLAELLRDADLGHRCRRAAEEHYGLEAACVRQLALYERLCRRTPVATVRRALHLGPALAMHSPHEQT